MIIFLIVAHKINSLKHLATVVGRDFDGLIHLDKRTYVTADDITCFERLSILDNRLSVHWGGFNLMQVEINLMEAALKKFPRGEKFVMISGDSLPTLSTADLEAFLSRDEEFLHIKPVPRDPSMAYASANESISKHGNVFPWRFYNKVFWDSELTNPMERSRIQRMFKVDENTSNYISGAAEQCVRTILLHVPRSMALFETFWFGSQWWALSRDTVERILVQSLRPAVLDFFRFMSVPDEHMIPTIIGNDMHLRPKFIASHNICHQANQASRAESTCSLLPRHLRFSTHRRPFVRKYDPDTSHEISKAIESNKFGELIS